MSTPIITFFNNKGGVGKTSLVYHTSWMLSELGLTALAVDLDPQANLTAAFLDEDALADLWEDPKPPARTIYQCAKPLLKVGDLEEVQVVRVTERLALIPGDLALAGFEDELAANWPRALGDRDLYRAFRLLTAFWHVAQAAARDVSAEVILFDVGPNLGALNRAALLATDFVVVPLAGDLFSIQGLRNLGPTLRGWRTGWEKRRANYVDPEFELPEGPMRPVGYVVQQHEVRLDRPARAYTRWLDRVPSEYRRSVLGLTDSDPALSVLHDPECLAVIKQLQEPGAHGARGEEARVLTPGRGRRPWLPRCGRANSLQRF